TSVNYSTVDYTATVSSDYSPTSGILNFAVGGPLSQTISVPIVTDATVESNEIFFVQLSNCVGCTTGGSSSYITDPQGMGTITNDDGPPSITINDVTLSEGNFGTRNFTFDITRSSNTNDVSVVYMPADSTANTPMDFTAIPTTLYFAAGGPLTHTVAVPVVGDMTVEPDETFYVNLSNCEGCNISDLQGMSTITNDDSAPATHMSDTTANTGQSVYSGRPIHAEYVSSTSQLVGDIIDTITIKLKKSGSPTGTAEIGVFNTDLSVKKSFGTKDVSTLTTSYTDYTLSLTGQTYQIQSGDRIGIKYTGGDSSTNISIMRDTTAADPFDGTNSYHTYYDTTWRVYTSNDLYMILIQSSSGTADIVAPITTPSPSGGTYTSVQSVTLTANEAATIYYTTNGSTPTTTSTVYTTAIPITTTTMLKFFAKDNAGNSESVKTQVYTIDSTAPTTTALPLGGTYTTAKSITLTVNEAANIYYTTDGSTPTISSTIYTTQIQISTTTTLKFFAQDAAGNSESVQTQVYIISAGSPITHMSDTTANTGQSVYSGRPIHAEYVSATSQLIGDTIDTITIKLKKNGSPTGTAEIGIFNADLTVKQLFATKDVSTLTTSYTDYTFSSSGQTYQIQSGDRIGVKYTGGDSSTNISIMRDTDVADPFDGANSYHVYYQTSWSSFTANDLYMILVQSNP
ncbi:MAG: putative xylanase/chitin deacetylase, partial [Nitrosarchaeum sp.]|nr:putative xylanase/chitin deacetylase [Nitrosarchaeum sp.]